MCKTGINVSFTLIIILVQTETYRFIWQLEIWIFTLTRPSCNAPGVATRFLCSIPLSVVEGCKTKSGCGSDESGEYVVESIHYSSMFGVAVLAFVLIGVSDES